MANWKDTATGVGRVPLPEPRFPAGKTRPPVPDTPVHHVLAELALRWAALAPEGDRVRLQMEARDFAQTALNLWQDLMGGKKNLQTLGYRIQAEQLKKQLK